MSIKINKNLAMNYFLTFRALFDSNIAFSDELLPNLYEPDGPFYNIKKEEDVELALKDYINPLFAKSNETALMLSGGIDSAILAKLVPEGTTAYTFKNIAEGAVNEVELAKQYAEENNLIHVVLPIYWEDFVKLTPLLMRHKGAPIHSIEVQIFKAALVARRKGFKNLLFGERADQVFGGQSQLYSKDWSLEEFYQRRTFLQPYKALKEPLKLINEYKEFLKADGYIDLYGFLNKYALRSSMGEYTNPCSLAKINFVSPYNKMRLAFDLDIERIRNGENKYILRRLFAKYYPSLEIQPKLPMPRAVGQWLANWGGPKRSEFLENLSMSDFTGDQKWLLYSLETFLDMLEGEGE